MKKFYTFILLALLCAAGIEQTKAQSVTTGLPSSPGSGSGANYYVTFVVKNNNSYAIIIDDIEMYRASGANGNTFTLFYNPTVLSGSPNLPTGWTMITSAVLSNISTTAIYPTFTNVNFTIPANTTYRFAVQTSGSALNYGASTTSPNYFTNAGVAIGNGNYQINGLNVGYWGPSTNPRFWCGTINFHQAAPCTAPPTPGTATASASSTCANGTVDLDLTGATGGLGQTYQWQSGPTSTGPWTNVGGVLNTAAYTATVAAATWFRCALTCTAMTTYSTPVQVTTNPNLPAGTYTINSALPTAGTNFHSFTDAVAALSCGIAGPVVFNVNAASGPYNEQIVIPSILNTSATNTVTFNCNNRVLSFAGTASNFSTLTLDDADHIIIKKLTIENTGTSNARGLLLTAGAKCNLIDSCKIDIGQTSTSSTTSALGIGASLTSATASGGICDSNTISNCEIIGGYYCVTLIGTSATLQTYTQFKNNVVHDYYLYGVYMNYNKDAQVEGNELHRMNRTGITTFYGVYNSTGNQKSFISKNKIHNPCGAATTSTSTCYFLYNSASSTSGNENVFSNNIIYNADGNGSHYYLYSSSTAYSRWYFNTVNSDFAGATSGSSYGMYQTGSPTNKIANNNIINITRGGTGVKYCAYNSSSSYAVTYNHNNYYSSASSKFYNGGALAALSNWQSSTSQDANSLSVVPTFVAPTTGNLTPTNLAMDNLGTPITGITTDILGTTRNTSTPDAGAFEFNNCDPITNLAASAFTTTTVTISWTAVSGSAGYEYVVNQLPGNPPGAGTANATTSVNVTGLTSGTTYYAHVRNKCSATSLSPWVTISFTTCTQATTTPTGTTTFCAGDSITFTANTGTTYQWKLNGNNITGATSNTFKAFAAGSYTVTINSPNGCVSTSAAAVVIVTAPVANITPTGNVNMCPGATTALNAPTGAGYTYQWNLNGTPVPGATSILYNAPAAGNYTVTVSSGVGCSTTTAAPTSIGLYTPPPATITPPASTAICPNTSITLNANTGTSLTYQWYLNNTSLGSAATNASYTGPGVGNYTVKVTNTTTGCSTTSSAISTTTAPAPTASASPVANLTGCDTVNLIANQGAGYTYQWLQGSTSLPGATNQIYQAIMTGPYSVKVTAPNGCFTVSSPATVTVHPSPLSSITYSSPLSFCYGGAVALSVYTSNGYTYQWNQNGVPIPGDTTAGHIAFESATFSVLVTNSFGCQKVSPAVQVVVNPLPIPVVTLTGNVLSTGTYINYMWFRDNQPVPGGNSQTYTTTLNGLYYVAVTDSNGCQNRSDGVFMNATGVHTVGVNSGVITLYPNPTHDIINISAPVKLNIAIQDLTGRTMITATDAQQIDVRNLANGVYMVQMRDLEGNLLKTERLFKVE